jgi:hypothetical protein
MCRLDSIINDLSEFPKSENAGGVHTGEGTCEGESNATRRVCRNRSSVQTEALVFSKDEDLIRTC